MTRLRAALATALTLTAASGIARAGTPTAATTTMPVAVAPTVAATPPADAATLLASLQAGDFASVVEAAVASETAMRKSGVKPTDVEFLNVQHVRAVALSRQGRTRQASDALQRIAPLAMSNRSVLVNVAIADLGSAATLPRSLKNLQAFAGAHPADEQVVNLWGSAMAKLGPKTSAAKLKEWETAYASVNSQLEATQPGQHHWGSRWVDAAEWASIDGERRVAQSQIDNDRQTVESRQHDVEVAQNNLVRTQNEPVRMGTYWYGDELYYHNQRVTRAGKGGRRGGRCAGEREREAQVRPRQAAEADVDRRHADGRARAASLMPSVAPTQAG